MLYGATMNRIGWKIFADTVEPTGFLRVYDSGRAALSIHGLFSAGTLAFDGARNKKTGWKQVRWNSSGTLTANTNAIGSHNRQKERVAYDG